MYGFPADLDLSSALGQQTTQLCIGSYDVQFSLGSVAFAVQSRAEVWRDGDLIGSWKAGDWPEPAFFQLINTILISFSVVDSGRLRLNFANGLELHLFDNSQVHESIQIYIESIDGTHII